MTKPPTRTPKGIRQHAHCLVIPNTWKRPTDDPRLGCSEPWCGPQSYPVGQGHDATGTGTGKRAGTGCGGRPLGNPFGNRADRRKRTRHCQWRTGAAPRPVQDGSWLYSRRDAGPVSFGSRHRRSFGPALYGAPRGNRSGRGCGIDLSSHPVSVRLADRQARAGYAGMGNCSFGPRARDRGRRDAVHGTDAVLPAGVGRFSLRGNPCRSIWRAGVVALQH